MSHLINIFIKYLDNLNCRDDLLSLASAASQEGNTIVGTYVFYKLKYSIL